MILTAVITAVFDLWTKYFLFHSGREWNFFSGLLRSVSHYNYGLIFNLPAPRFFIVTLSLLVLGIVLNFFRDRLEKHVFIAIGVGLLTGGALGNLYDRVVFGFVRDWILAFGISAFNIADIAIATGFLLLIKQHGQDS